jgi:O-antigen chain-terminating methyltransferase
LIEKNDSIKEIVDKLKKEIEKRKHSGIDLSLYKRDSFQKELNTMVLKEPQHSSFYLFAKKVAKYLQRKGLYKFVSFVQARLNLTQYHYVYEINDFVKYYDKKFLDNAFNIIYQQKANEDEKHLYLSYLRSGEKSKIEILALIRYSKEGESTAIKILGLKKRFFLFKLLNIPKIGYLFKLLYTLLTLPKLIKRINYFENFTEERRDQLNNHIKQNQEEISNQLNQKIDRAELQMPPIPNTIEIEAINFLLDAHNNFPYSLDKLSSFDKDERYYSIFESTFYNHKVVLEKQKIYLNYIPTINTANQPHLDIGCGRGELLSILEANNHKTIGIDINSLEISHLREKGFNVEHKEMIDFLQTTSQTFSSISALQVIEHIDHHTLKKFISLSYEKIEKGGVIMLETINPHNPVAFNSFYMDETHKKPLPPEMVAFMLQYMGFKNIKFLFISPMPEEFRSRTDERINYHDYAVIGYKNRN